jgi:hypothetical protein
LATQPIRFWQWFGVLLTGMKGSWQPASPGDRLRGRKEYRPEQIPVFHDEAGIPLDRLPLPEGTPDVRGYRQLRPRRTRSRNEARISPSGALAATLWY